MCDERNHIIAYEKGPLLFVINLNHSNSYEGYRVPVRNEGTYRCILSVIHVAGNNLQSDLPDFHGENRVSLTSLHYTQPNSQGPCMFFIQIYSPTLTVNIYKRV